MPAKSSFRAALERPAATRADRRDPSVSPAHLILRAPDGLPRPVAVARLLMAHGVGLRTSHGIINHLSKGEAPVVEILTKDVADAVSELCGLGLTISEIRRPTADAKDVRQALGLTQKEFAIRFGLELRTIQNWEQRRHGFDAATNLLLALIRDRPETVEQVLTNP